MNNILPSDLPIHEKYDLKGSTYKRKASSQERSKSSPTFKDLDFLEIHPDGIILDERHYDNIISSLKRDCLVSDSFRSAIDLKLFDRYCENIAKYCDFITVAKHTVSGVCLSVLLPSTLPYSHRSVTLPYPYVKIFRQYGCGALRLRYGNAIVRCSDSDSTNMQTVRFGTVQN